MSNPGATAPAEKTLTDTNRTSDPMKRLLSLDVLRGITIAFMIMVNNNGGEGSWGFMNHAQWNGLTATDLVFPTFVFVVGISVVFSTEARLARGASRAELVRHTVVRALILVLLGIVVNSFPFFHLDHMRFYGVLQRIGICYLVVALFYLFDRRAWTKWAALAVALVGYWVLVRWVPVPGLGAPGRDIPFMDMNRNLVSWIDQHLFPHHLYLYAPDFNTRDPEGLLSDLPAIGTALMGVLTGIWLRAGRSVYAKQRGLAAACGRASLVLGYPWSLEFPLNKNMWTSSFRSGGGRLLAGGAGAGVLGRGSKGLAQGLDVAVAGVWLECDCRLHDQRTAFERAVGRFRRARCMGIPSRFRSFWRCTRCGTSPIPDGRHLRGPFRSPRCASCRCGRCGGRRSL